MALRDPGQAWTSILRDATTGEAGLWSVALLDANTGVVFRAATNTGVHEIDGASGNYGKTFTESTPGLYQAEWIKGAEKQLDDDLLQVGGSQPVIASGLGYTSVSAVRQVLAPDGDTSVTLGTAASLSDSELQEAIDEGAVEINARLASRYTVPLTPIPAIVEKINRDIASYQATLTYQRNIPLGQDHPIRLRAARAFELLKAIGAGKIELTNATGAIGETADAEVINTIGLEDGESLFELSDMSLASDNSAWPWSPGPWGEV